MPFNSATAVMPWKINRQPIYCVYAMSLQFGHGGDAVENSPSWLGTWVKSVAFNSATAVMPWKMIEWAEGCWTGISPSIRPRR